jgi:hypothetical protein
MFGLRSCGMRNLFLLAVLALVVCIIPGARSQSPGISIEHAGLASFATNEEFLGTQLGGLSGLTFDGTRWFAISDHGSKVRQTCN